jgi:hypothetical protein
LEIRHSFVKDLLIVTKSTKISSIFDLNKFFEIFKNEIIFERILFRFGATKVKIEVLYTDSNLS